MEWLLRLVDSDVEQADAPIVKRRLSMAMGWFGCLLFAVTWPLWFQPTAFPAVPLFGVLLSMPMWLHVVTAALAAASIASLALRTSFRAYLLIAFLLLSLVSLNQHRLQPWLIQLGLLAVFAWLLSGRDFVKFARLLLVSIYVFSAISKFDYQFTHTLGQQFLETLTGFVGLDVSDWAERTRVVLALMFPVSESLVAFGLLFPRTRFIAAWAAIAVHGGLLLILGPLGLKHHFGVLTWNLFLILQIWILFLGQRRSEDRNEKTQFRTEEERGSSLRRYIALTLLLLPALEPLSLYDHWPAWQLYAPRNSRVTMDVLEPAAAKLPASLCVRDTNSPWVRVRLDQMSFDQAWVPIYPQDRFQVGVALAIAERYDLQGGLRVTVQGVSDRWNGERSEQTFRSNDELLRLANTYRLNAKPAK